VIGLALQFDDAREFGGIERGSRRLRRRGQCGQENESRSNLN
jgi:hypothetical protein